MKRGGGEKERKKKSFQSMCCFDLLLADEIITLTLIVIFILQFHTLVDFRFPLSILHMFIE